MSGLLLDTHAAIWLVEDKLGRDALDAAIKAGLGGRLYISPVTAWEVGLLSRSPRRGGPRFLPDPESWVAELMGKPIVTPAPLTASMAVSSSCLPGTIHDDPADRLLIATAREMRATLMTRDQKILDYAADGHLNVIAC